MLNMQSFFFSDVSFICPVLLIILSLISFYFEKEKISLLLLFTGSIFLGVFIAGLDPFINLWDEQFHALVAKNLLSHPLTPTLIEMPIFPFDASHWAYQHVWLHKQPLFLWQMALSLKIFGFNVIGVRFPSILMHSVMIFFIYRTGQIFASKKTGYYSALLFTCAYFPLEYLTGFYATDHNDFAFLFYSFGSLWALTEYYHSKETKFIFIIGIFAGAAILCKWLVGLLAYGIWILLIYLNKKTFPLLKEVLKLLLSLFICLLVFVPWQIYCYMTHTSEYLNEMAFNSLHITKALEGHGGDCLFYYEALFEQFGEGLIIPPLILICSLFTIYSIKDRSNKLIFISSITILYVFFTIVKTKMYGYVFTAFPFFIIGLAFSLNYLIEKAVLYTKRESLKRTIAFILTFTILVFVFNSSKIYKHHSNKEYGRYKSRTIEIREKQFFESIKKHFKNEKCLIFNCHTSMQSHILAIFHTDYPSFNFVLSQKQISEVKKLNYTIISIDDDNLPEYIIKDRSIIKLKFKPF